MRLLLKEKEQNNEAEKIIELRKNLNSEKRKQLEL